MIPITAFLCFYYCDPLGKNVRSISLSHKLRCQSTKDGQYDSFPVGTWPSGVMCTIPRKMERCTHPSEINQCIVSVRLNCVIHWTKKIRSIFLVQMETLVVVHTSKIILSHKFCFPLFQNLSSKNEILVVQCTRENNFLL